MKRGIGGKKERIFSGRPVHVVSEAVSNEERSLFPSPGYPRLGYRRTKGRHTIGSYHHCSSCVSRARAETPKWVNTNNYAACASAHTREFFLIPLHRYTSIPTYVSPHLILVNFPNFCQFMRILDRYVAERDARGTNGRVINVLFVGVF